QIDSWRSDLALARAQLVEIHPDPWRKVSADVVELAFAGLAERLPHLSPAAATLTLAEIFAALGDGHTRLTLPLPADSGFVEGHLPTEPPAFDALRLHTLPIRLGIYAEGVFVERIEDRHRRFAGSRVVALGGVPIAEAMARLAPVVRHDNPSQLLDLLPMHLVVPELLHFKGLSDEPLAATWTLSTAGDDTFDVRLRAQEYVEIDWATPFAAPPVAASLRHLRPGLAPRRGAFGSSYWFDLLPGTRTLYLQYNVAESRDDAPMSNFAARLRARLAADDVERLVVDLRWNWGGDNSLSRPLLHALIASERLREPGALVVLIGRGTFSAGMMFATDLERHLRPLFVGESTGSSPNHAGDSRKLRLPFTGLTLRISTLWWQYGDPRDRRDAIAPHVPIAPSWRALVAGRDEALDAVVAPPSAADLTGRWRGTMTPPAQQFPLELVLTRASGALAGVLSAGPLGEALELSDIRRHGARFAFRVPRDGGGFEFEGVVLGERIVGHVVYAGVRAEAFAFGLERSGE
ncbi:MAG: hypothetical protein NDJ75_11825, partial [Thermoanaerobaculia bacterium]|nr:hypothetical protein [Thermoanaerobaculia bacterium]